MRVLRTLHPPGGVTALIAVVGGALIMLVIALLVNNIPKQHRSPEFWL